jgi:hypothetical protein
LTNRFTGLLPELRRHKIARTNKKSTVIHMVVAKMHRCTLLLLLLVQYFAYFFALSCCLCRFVD